MNHSAEQLLLLQQYITIFTIILGLPAVGLFFKKDHRFRIAIVVYIILIIISIFLYVTGNKIFFPDDTLLKK